MVPLPRLRSANYICNNKFIILWVELTKISILCGHIHSETLAGVHMCIRNQCIGLLKASLKHDQRRRGRRSDGRFSQKNLNPNTRCSFRQDETQFPFQSSYLLNCEKSFNRCEIQFIVEWVTSAIFSCSQSIQNVNICRWINKEGMAIFVSVFSHLHSPQCFLKIFLTRYAHIHSSTIN